jgi:HD-GYP domain-containing protein (c-di-GMP phosphodiesterase class II)
MIGRIIMLTYKSSVEKDLLSDVQNEISEMLLESEQVLIQLEQDAENKQLLRALFRFIHTIKSSLTLVEMTPLIPLLSATEDVLDYIRNGKLSYSSICSDLLLLILDRVQTFISDCYELGKTQYDNELFDQLSILISKIQPDTNMMLINQHLVSLVSLLDPNISFADPQQEMNIHEQLSSEIEEEISHDLSFFRQLMAPVEFRSQYWRGRTERIVKIAVLLNREAAYPINESQLVAACYVHDFGMAFMPLKMLHKNTPLTASEYQLMESHVQASADLFTNMPNWQEAKQIVLQHHERVDGKGYPNRLNEKNICDGAKILAIADTFEAMTHQRAWHSHQKRPIVRAMAEINLCANKQLSSVWVMTLQRMINKKVQKK